MNEINPNIKAPADPRTKVMILLALGFLSFLVCLGVWIWRLIDLSQKEKNKTFKNSLWLTFFLPLGLAFPILYMASLSMMAGFISNASWWVNPTIIFTAMDVAFLGAGVVGGYLPGKTEEEVSISLTKIESTFQCGICYNKYSQDFFGAETVKEGKICRSCLARKQLEAK
jgi:hypothetical protein